MNRSRLGNKSQYRPVPWTGLAASALSGQQRRAVWEHIKQSDPDLADCLQGEFAQAMRSEFDAAPVFEVALINTALQQSGLEPINVRSR